MHNGAMSHGIANLHPHINESRCEWKLTNLRGLICALLNDCKTAYFQLKNVIFNTNTIMPDPREYRAQPRGLTTHDVEIKLRQMHIMKRSISTSLIEI